jgi:hypothetical protein
MVAKAIYWIFYKLAVLDMDAVSRSSPPTCAVTRARDDREVRDLVSRARRA